MATASEAETAVAQATARLRRRTLAANILVVVAMLALALMAIADAVLLAQWNFVTRMLMLGVLLLVGWIPAAAAITAVCLRPHWATFLAMGLVGAAVLATLARVYVLA